MQLPDEIPILRILLHPTPNLLSTLVDQILNPLASDASVYDPIVPLQITGDKTYSEAPSTRRGGGGGLFVTRGSTSPTSTRSSSSAVPLVFLISLSSSPTSSTERNPTSRRFWPHADQPTPAPPPSPTSMSLRSILGKTLLLPPSPTVSINRKASGMSLSLTSVREPSMSFNLSSNARALRHLRTTCKREK
jgi:hypothetical protein